MSQSTTIGFAEATGVFLRRFSLGFCAPTTVGCGWGRRKERWRLWLRRCRRASLLLSAAHLAFWARVRVAPGIGDCVGLW